MTANPDGVHLLFPNKVVERYRQARVSTHVIHAATLSQQWRGSPPPGRIDSLGQRRIKPQTSLLAWQICPPHRACYKLANSRRLCPPRLCFAPAQVPAVDFSIRRAHGAADGSDAEILCLAFVSADAPLLASAGNDCVVRCWGFREHACVLLAMLEVCVGVTGLGLYIVNLG